MKEEYRQILKNSSKKRSLFEAITGLKLTDVLIVVFVLLAIAVNSSILMYFRTELFGKADAISYIVFSFFLGAFLIIPEAMVLGLFVIFVIYIFVDIPLLCNRKYLPLETEEIRNLPFKKEKEFYEFVRSLYGKQFLGSRFLADSNKLRDDIAVMVAKYIQINNASLDKMPDELRKYLEKSQLWMDMEFQRKHAETIKEIIK